MAGRTFKVAGRDILVDVGHANQWLVQFLYILGVQFDGELVTGSMVCPVGEMSLRSRWIFMITQWLGSSSVSTSLRSK